MTRSRVAAHTGRLQARTRATSHVAGHTHRRLLDQNIGIPPCGNCSMTSGHAAWQPSTNVAAWRLLWSNVQKSQEKPGTAARGLQEQNPLGIKVQDTLRHVSSGGGMA